MATRTPPRAACRRNGTGAPRLPLLAARWGALASKRGRRRWGSLPAMARKRRRGGQGDGHSVRNSVPPRARSRPPAPLVNIAGWKLSVAQALKVNKQALLRGFVLFRCYLFCRKNGGESGCLVGFFRFSVRFSVRFFGRW